MPRRRRHAPQNLPRAWHWTDDANCSDEDPSVFFPNGTTGLALLDIRYAKSICRACPVRSACLDHALNFREDHGVWGGLDEDERAEVLRAKREAAERQRRRARTRARAASAA
ncbi:WhiB family transcriptional regulator [Streptomycetaceae bacterium NBC_01309]